MIWHKYAFLLFTWTSFTDAEDISGGETVKEGECPYAVMVYSGAGSCTGSLIKTNVVVTAGHCIHDGDQELYQIVAGVVLTNDFSSKRQKLGVSRLIQHPDFSKDEVNPSDVGVLILNGHFKLGDTVKTIKLKTDDSPVESAITYGWGLTSSDAADISDVLKKATVEIQPSSVCKQAAINTFQRPPDYNTDLVYCGLGGKYNFGVPCKGDSGGPLVCDGLLCGLTSFGEVVVNDEEPKNCTSPDVPIFYTKLSVFHDWIEKVSNV